MNNEFEKYLEKVENPNYQGGSLALPENATSVEKAKYQLCKQMIIYKREKQLSIEKIAKQIDLNETEVEDILHYRINYFTLEGLMNYTSKLFPTSEIKLIIERKESLLHA